MISLYPFNVLIPNPAKVPELLQGFRFLNPFRSRLPKPSFSDSNRTSMHILTSTIPTHTESKQTFNRFTSNLLRPIDRLYVDFHTRKTLRKPNHQIKEELQKSGVTIHDTYDNFIRTCHKKYTALHKECRSIVENKALPVYRKKFRIVNANTMLYSDNKGFNANRLYTDPVSQATLNGGMMPDPQDSKNMTAFVGLCREKKIGLIIDLTENHEHADYQPRLKNLEVHIERKPTPDHAPIDQTLLKDLAKTINTALEKRKNVYVHCKGGNGRTGQACAAAAIVRALDKNTSVELNALELVDTALKEVRSMRASEMVNFVSYMALVEFADTLLAEKPKTGMVPTLETPAPTPSPEYETILKKAKERGIPEDSLTFLVAKELLYTAVNTVNYVLYTTAIRAFLETSGPHTPNTSLSIHQEPVHHF